MLGNGEFPNLVQKKGPSLGLLQESFSTLAGTSERTPLVTEEFTLEKTLRNPGAVHRLIRTLGPGAFKVDHSAEEALSGPRLSENQDRHIYLCGLHRKLPDPAHDGTGAQQRPDASHTLFHESLSALPTLEGNDLEVGREPGASPWPTGRFEPSLRLSFRKTTEIHRGQESRIGPCQEHSTPRRRRV